MVALGLQRTSRHQELRGPAAIPAPVAIGGDALTAASRSPAPPAVPPRTRITVRNVTKAFGGNAQALALLQSGADRAEVQARTGAVVGLHKVSFDVAEGEILVVMGLSGSGKSTLLRCLNRLIEPSSGSVAVDGTEVTALSGKALLEFRRAKFGMVFQSFALFPNRTVLGNVEYGLEIQGMVKAKRRDMAMRAIETVGLKGWDQKYPNQLSGGMQQRAGLARALAADAPILLMDEAFSALDPLIRRDMQAELRQLQAGLRKTVVFVSHDLDEAIALGGRIVLMKDGGIVQIGEPEEILLRPATDYVSRFVEHIDVASVLTAGRLADASAVSLHTGMSVTDAKVAVVGCTMSGWFVTDGNGRLVGQLDRDALTLAGSGDSVGSLMRPSDGAVPSGRTLKSVLPALASSRDGLAVVSDEGRLIGRLTSRSAIAAMAGAEHRRAATSGAGVASSAVAVAAAARE